MANSEINIQIDTGGTAAQSAAEAAARRAISAAGHAPMIGEDGNWQVWDVEAGAYVDTGTLAQGGTGVESAAINADGHLIFTMTDGSTLDAGNVFTAVDEAITENGERSVTGGAVYNALKGKADTRHEHEQSDVNGLAEALTGKADAVHTHEETDITGLTNALSGKASAEDVSLLDSVRTARDSPASSRGFPQYDGAILTITDDDGTLRFLNEHVPVYKAHGVTATTAVVASRAITPVGTTTSGDPYEAMTFEQLRQLRRDGFDIQNHTWSHARSVFNSAYNANVTEDEIDAEYRQADEAFRANGFDCECLVFPWGAHTAAHLNLAKRYARFGVNCRGMDGMNNADTDPMDLNRLSATTDGGNLASLKAAIDAAISRKCWLIILTHAGASQPDAASLDALLTYAEQKGIRIENFRDAARIKAPAYYAGEGDSAFRVMPDGAVTLSLKDEYIARMIARAYEMGCISPSANYAASLSAEYTGNALSAGDTLNKADVTVTVAFHDGTTAQTTDFTIDAPYTISAGENTFAVRYGTVSGTLTVTAAATGAQTLLLEHVTQYAGTDERDRVWFGRHMEAGTYNLHITLSDTLGSNASGGDALILKTASAYGDSAGTQLFNVSITNAMGKTGFTGTITLPEATDGFFLYAKMFKVGVTISAYVDGAVSNTTLMDLTTIGTLQGSAASPGAAWFPVTLSAKAYYYKLSVGGSSPTAVPAVLCQTAASDGDTAGTALFSYDGSACTGGATMEGSFTLTEASSFIYISFTPGSKSTFEVTLSVI